jgi:hypothetical protein
MHAGLPLLMSIALLGPAAPPTSDAEIPLERYQLANGLTVVLHDFLQWSP